MFRFQTGSIKRRKGILVPLSHQRFRFQTGSIKSGTPCALRTLLIVFRFQTGSIKSKASASGSFMGIGFDSKLVRLKGHRMAFIHSYNAFRFQTGSIKSLEPHKEHLDEIRCFDSKLVRLKVPCCEYWDGN